MFQATFNEVAGATTENTENGALGTLSSGAALSGDGSAIFDGTVGNKIDWSATDPAAYATLNSDFSIEIEYTPTSFASSIYHPLFYLKSDTTQPCHCYLSTNDSYSLHVGGTGLSNMDYENFIFDPVVDTPYHIVFLWNASTEQWEAYVNNAPLTISLLRGGFSSQANDTYLGVTPSAPTQRAEGEMKYIRVWDRKLSEAEIATLYSERNN